MIDWASLSSRGAHGLREGDRTASGPGPQRRAATIFRRRMNPQRVRPQSSGFASRNKIAAARCPPLALRPLSLRSAVPARPARRLVIAVKDATGAADPTKGITATTAPYVDGFV